MKYFLIMMALVSTTAWAQVPAASEHSVRPRVPRIKIFRANPHRLAAIRLQGTDPYDAPDDDYICSSGARRPKVVNTPEPASDELSAYVQVRLALARARALSRYRELHA